MRGFATGCQDDTFTCRRDADRVAPEEQLDGLRTVRTNVEPERFDATRTVRAGKDLSKGACLKRPNFFLPAAHFALDNFFEAGRPFLDKP